MKKVMLTTTVVLMLLGCQKGTASKANDETTAQDFSYNSGYNRAAEGNNSLDWIGTFHNKLLDSAAVYTKFNSSLDPQSIYEVMQKHCPHFVSSDASLIQTHLKSITPEHQHALIYNTDSLIRASIADTSAQRYALAVADALRATVASNYFLTKNRITLIENRIQNDQKLSENDRRTLLAMTSVTRHSFSFWLDKMGSEPAETMGFLRDLAAAVNAAIADASAIVLCSFLQFPLEWWPDISGIASTGAYWTIMGW